MSIDIVTQSSSLEVLQDFCVKHRLGKMVDGEFTLRKGLTVAPWNADGRFKTKNATYDGETQLTAATYAAGFVAILRFRDDFRIRVTKTIDGEQVTVNQSDNLEGSEEQHTRSRIFRYVKNNGVKGKTGTINHWKLDGVKLYRYPDVMAFLDDRGLAKFVRGGGNRP